MPTGMRSRHVIVAEARPGYGRNFDSSLLSGITVRGADSSQNMKLYRSHVFKSAASANWSLCSMRGSGNNGSSLLQVPASQQQRGGLDRPRIHWFSMWRVKENGHWRNSGPAVEITRLGRIINYPDVSLTWAERCWNMNRQCQAISHRSGLGS